MLEFSIDGTRTNNIKPPSNGEKLTNPTFPDDAMASVTISIK